MEDFQTSDISQLVNLFNLGLNNSDIDENDYLSTENTNSCTEQMNKSIKDDKKSQKTTAKMHNNYAKLETSRDIWSDDEIPDEDYDEIQTKQEPKYEMFYQQEVTSHDIFLQLHEKGPGSNSCECLLLRIELENVSSSDEIMLKVSEISVVCKTDTYFLHLNLPKHVDPESCTAKWNQSTKLLEVKLLLDNQELLPKKTQI